MITYKTNVISKFIDTDEASKYANIPSNVYERYGVKTYKEIYWNNNYLGCALVSIHIKYYDEVLKRFCQTKEYIVDSNKAMLEIDNLSYEEQEELINYLKENNLLIKPYTDEDNFNYLIIKI